MLVGFDAPRQLGDYRSIAELCVHHIRCARELNTLDRHIYRYAALARLQRQIIWTNSELDFRGTDLQAL